MPKTIPGSVILVQAAMVILLYLVSPLEWFAALLIPLFLALDIGSLRVLSQEKLKRTGIRILLMLFSFGLLFFLVIGQVIRMKYFE